jgi:L-galactose dehydrogenase
MIPYFKSKNVGVINASPLSMGLLTHQGPPEWHPAQSDIKEGNYIIRFLCWKSGWPL